MVGKLISPQNQIQQYNNSNLFREPTFLNVNFFYCHFFKIDLPRPWYFVEEPHSGAKELHVAHEPQSADHRTGLSPFRSMGRCLIFVLRQCSTEHPHGCRGKTLGISPPGVVDIMGNMGEVGIMVEMVDTGEVMEVAMTMTVEMREWW